MKGRGAGGFSGRPGRGLSGGLNGGLSGGFTFLELVVTIFIISAFLAIAYPSLRLLDRNAGPEADRFASLVRYLNDSAINRKTIYEMSIDFKAGQIAYESPEGKKQVKLDTLTEVYTSSLGGVKDGELKIFFDKTGLAEIMKATFAKGDEAFVVTYNPYSRQVKVKPKVIKATDKNGGKG
ncbi:MAG: prepilin-type N-terminal cleavage/methylation domain-containing protein [Nitrospirae bacterium]|nr:prepilin-type N-terminal cleavage/methylation domain-containing protein [Nitrospirota bacterium]